MYKWATLLLEVLFPLRGDDALLLRVEPHVLERAALTRNTVGIARALAPLPYTHKLVSCAVRAAKYRNHERAAWLLGTAIAPFVGEEIADKRNFGTFYEALVVPIPLHKKRRRERGYNQAERIAQAVVDALPESGLLLAPQVLVRTRNTPSQVRIQKRKERLANVRGAFAVPDPAGVHGRDIIVLDDVTTTGATLAGAAQALKKAGAREVLCVAAAH